MLAKVLQIFLIGVSIGVSVNSLEVKTSSGVVRGKTVQVLNKEINQFFGIPFGEPPVGKLRFAKPIPLKEPKKGIIDATKEGNSCLQHVDEKQSGYSEDCLNLNIYSHNISESKPVMFWIFGGGLNFGSASSYDGTVLATHDVVVVTVNYRLGTFGFLYSGDESAPGNMGFYDQLLGLKWVKQNIHSFGGDPNQITIFGESAGSWSVSALVLSPLSRGLFQRAILQSCAIYDNKDIPNLTKETAINKSKIYAKTFNCTGDKWVDCLRTKDAKTLLYKAPWIDFEGSENPGDFTPYPLQGTEFLPLTTQSAFNTHNYSTEIDILGGVMRNEGSMLAGERAAHLKNADEFKALVKKLPFPKFDADKIAEFYLKNLDKNNTTALKKAFWNLFGDIVIACPTFHFAKAFAEHTQKRNVFFYEWTYVSDDMRGSCTKEMGVCHSNDLGYVFGRGSWGNPVDKKFSEDIQKMWTNFAKNGKPMDGFPSDHQWPRMIQVGSSNSAIKVKELNPSKTNHIIDNLFADSCDGFWKSYYN